MNKEAADKVSKAKCELIIHHPFFATLLLGMPTTQDDSVGTLGTDGESIVYSPEWVLKHTFHEVVFGLAHEVGHCILDHMGRRGSRNHNKYNIAADYVLNEILVKEKIGSMPHGSLYNPALTARAGGTAEGVYKILPKEDENKKPGTPGGSLDNMTDPGTKNGTQKTTQATISEQSAAMKVRVIAARNAAKMQGKMSANLERLVEDMLEPVVDWRDVLRRFVSEKAKVEYSFARPKRRFLHTDLILPSLVGERMGAVIVAVDCSGSISPKLISEFSAEIKSIKEDLLPNLIEVVYFDSKVCGVEKFGPDDDLTIVGRGGGGTDFAPVMKYINSREEEDPAAVVFLTDLICDSFGEQPHAPVLWAVLEGVHKGWDKVPFGEILKIKPE